MCLPEGIDTVSRLLGRLGGMLALAPRPTPVPTSDVRVLVERHLARTAEAAPRPSVPWPGDPLFVPESAKHTCAHIFEIRDEIEICMRGCGITWDSMWGKQSTSVT